MSDNIRKEDVARIWRILPVTVNRIARRLGVHKISSKRGEVLFSKLDFDRVNQELDLVLPEEEGDWLPLAEILRKYGVSQSAVILQYKAGKIRRRRWTPKDHAYSLKDVTEWISKSNRKR